MTLKTFPLADELARATGLSADQHAACFLRLCEWIGDDGGRVGPVELAWSGGMRGVSITHDVVQGQEILFVPRRCLLREEPRAPATPTRAEELSLHSLLAWRLCDLHHRRPAEWQPYLDMLPSGFLDHPLAGGPRELASFPSVMRMAIQLTQQEMQQNYDALREALPLVPPPDLERFAWAFCCVTSRVFAEAPATPVLFPLADLLNHSFEPTCRVKLEADGVHVFALRDLPAHTPATLTYANAPNVMLLCAYGFCCEDHPCDRMPAGGPAYSPQLHERLVREGSPPLRAWTTQIAAAFDDAGSRRMLTAIRSTLRAPFRLLDAPEQVAPEVDEDARVPATRTEELAAMDELASLCAEWTADLHDRTSPPADGSAHALAMGRMADRLVDATLRIVGHFTAMASAAAVALRHERRDEALALLAALPDAAYADELRAHADRLWPLPATL